MDMFGQNMATLCQRETCHVRKPAGKRLDNTSHNE